MSPLVPLPLIQIKRKKNRSLLELSVSLSQNLKNNRRAGAVAQPKGSGLNLQGCTHKMSETQIINMAPRAHFRASLPPLPLAPATPDCGWVISRMLERQNPTVHKIAGSIISPLCMIPRDPSRLLRV